MEEPIIKEFLETVLGESEGRVSIWRRREYGRKAPIDAQRWFSYPAELPAMVQEVMAHSGNDVYFTPALYSVDKREPQNTTTANTVWCDADTADPSAFRLQPSYIVQSSEGRWQTYWILDAPVKASEASRIARRIAHAHKHEGADISSWPSNKIMRIPQTTNTNYDWPFEVQGHNTGLIYTLADLEDAYPLEEETESATVKDSLTVRATTPAPETLPAFIDVQGKLPADFNIDLIMSEPADGLRSEMRWKLIAELVEAGLTDEETAAIAWEAKCSSKWHEDPRGIDGLWMEIAKERARYVEATANPPEPEEPKKPRERTRAPKPIHILSEEDRRRAKTLWGRTWIGEYEEWMKASLDIYNGPYHRAAAWSALSALLGDLAVFRKGKRYIPLNIWTWTIGPTTSGKSEARDGMQTVVHRAYLSAMNPDIGDDSSAGALYEKLHALGGKSALFNSDEADGLIEESTANGSWKVGVMSKWTYLYDGRVPPQLRRGQTDGEWDDCVFNMYMSGTEEGVMGVLTRSMFAKGFLTRMVWFIGENMTIPEEKLGFADGGDFETDLHKIMEWRARFRSIEQRWSMQGIGDARPLIKAESDETREFFRAATAKIQTGALSKERNWDIIKPSIIRLSTTMYKMACLLALSAGRSEVTRDDMLVALLQGEELLGNLLYVANGVADSEHSKSLDMLETAIAQYPAGAKSSEIYRIMASKGLTKRDSDGYRDELKAQRRIKVTRSTDGFGEVWTVLE